MSQIEGDPTLFLWMTREEFLAAYGYQLTAWLHPAYFGAEIPDQERDGRFGSVEWAMKSAIRELIHQGFRFSGLELDRKDKVIRSQDTPVETRNALFLAKIEMGRWINPIAALKQALHEIEERALPIDRGPIMEVLIQCEKDAAAAEANMKSDPETYETAMKWLEEQMRLSGMTKETTN